MKKITKWGDIKKKNIPIGINDFFNFLSTINDNEVEVVYNKQNPLGPLWKATDKDPESDFYFQISSFNELKSNKVNEPPKLTLDVEWFPSSVNDLRKNEKIIPPVKIKFKDLYNDWIQIVRTYNSHNLYMGPEERIIHESEEEFYDKIYTNFEILDEDASYSSFDFDTQLKLDQYLDTVFKILEANKNEENEEKIEDVKKDVLELKEKQANLTKDRVVHGLAKILAKAKSISIHLVVEIGKGLIVDAAKGFLIGLTG